MTADEDPEHLREVVVDREVVYRGRYLELRIDTFERVDGSRGTREIVWHPGAVAIVALDAEDRVALVRQFRLAAGRALLELPAGTLDVGPDGTVEDPDRAGPRELEEETGLRAAEWRRLTSFWTAPGFATELMHLYLATGLAPADGERLEPDDDEHLEMEWLPLAEAVRLAESGGIADAKSLVGLLWVARLRGL